MRLKGNSPDRRLRSPNQSYSVKDVSVPRQVVGWLRGSHPLKSV